MLQMTQEQWDKRPYTDVFTRGAWEFRGRDYPEEWIGRRNTLALDKTSGNTTLLTEGVSFEIVGENEWQEENLRVCPEDIEYEDESNNIVTAYVESWFDVDQKFGTKVHQCADAWLNLYATLNLSESLLSLQYVVCNPTLHQQFPYTPTTKERELVIRLIREALAAEEQ